MLANKKYLRFTIKLIFGLGVFFFIGWKVVSIFQENQFSEVEFHQSALPIILVVFVLMFINWSVEAVKWKQLMRNLKSLSFKSALFGVLAGVSTGIVTPNRLGNFIGRTAFLEPEMRLKATLLTLLANLSQFLVTIFFGCLGLMFMGSVFLGFSNLYLLLVGAVVLIAGLAIFINPNLINRKPFNYFFSNNVEQGIAFITTTRLQIKLVILGWSTVRYLVFVTQYVLLLYLFNQTQEVITLLASVTVVYLLMTLIPSLFFGKLFVREAAALLILASIGVPDTVILLTGFLLWFINIAIPSLIGASLLIRKK